jgi:hypothetical protein
MSNMWYIIITLQIPKGNWSWLVFFFEEEYSILKFCLLFLPQGFFFLCKRNMKISTSVKLILSSRTSRIVYYCVVLMWNDYSANLSRLDGSSSSY